MTSPVLERALECAGRGWPVFPCHPGAKAPATRHGHRDATTDPGQITRWLAGHPELNLAVATGAPGPDILDVDQRGPAGNGFTALARLEAAGLLAGSAATVRTPSGGLHLYFAGTTQRAAHLPASHLDFLACGSYALIPPSRIRGTPYEHIAGSGRGGELDWHAALTVLSPTRNPTPHGPQPAGAQPADLQPADIRPAGPGQPGPRQPGPGEPDTGQVTRLARWVAAQREGNRNSALFWAANRALEADHAADLSPLAAAARQAGLTTPEITRTLHSARRTTRAQPQPHPRGREAEGAS